jgi:hypothetical protein
MKRAVLLAAVVVLALGAWLWQRGGLGPGHVTGVVHTGQRIAGGDGGGLPRAQPAEEKLDAAALAHATALADASGITALLVVRHGHLLLEHYARGARADQLLDGGAMTGTVLALASQDARQISARLWQPLNAHEAWLDGCCLQARYGDWLRVGILLAADGRFEGAEVIPATLIRQLRSDGTGLEPGSKAGGAEPVAIHDVYYLKGRDRTRLWVAPSLQLVVLHVAGAAGANGWDETQLFNQIVRAVTDRGSEATSTDKLSQLVPGH